ncbi:hypothetical protein ACJMK2_026732 [Sinanodonta woodiana]|uniref:Uncharacterized protein n=1 Tax=Sinanodonta woodiana TaxID=1069815 RepID=A0ABD3XKN1_SINWO
MASTVRPLNGTNGLTIDINPEQVDIVSIILWILGGILLIALLALMARMIMWRRRGITRAPPIIRPQVFRIRIDAQYQPRLTEHTLFWRQHGIWNWIPYLPSGYNTSSHISSPPTSGECLRLAGGIILHPPSYSEVMSSSLEPRVQISHDSYIPSSPSSHLPPL